METQGEAGKLYNQILRLAKDAREGQLDMKTAAEHARGLIRESTTINVAEGEVRTEGQDPKVDDRP